MLYVIEGPVLSTWDFATRYALFALNEARAVLIQGVVVKDLQLARRGLDALFDLWRVGELRHGVSAARILADDNWWNMARFRQEALLSLESLMRHLDTGGIALDPEILLYPHYFAARMHISMFDKGDIRVDHLVSAAEHFEALNRSGSLVARALARPYVDWFRIDRHRGQLRVNGLAIEATERGIAITIVSQRRTFIVGGLAVEEILVGTREASWIARESLDTISGAQPQIDWAGVPAVVPVLMGRCRSDQRTCVFMAVQVPTRSWDTWVIHFGSEGTGPAVFDFPFEHRRTDSEVILTADTIAHELHERVNDDCHHATLQAEMIPGGTRVSTHAEQFTLTLRATPTVVTSDAAILIKNDHPLAGAVAAAVYPLSSPSPIISSALIRAFSPFFVFDDAVDERALRHICASTCTQVIIVGIPSRFEDIARLIHSLFDPRREISFLISEAETETLLRTMQQVLSNVESRLDFPLYQVAASVDEESAAPMGVQIITVERNLAPAAAQMMLDVAAFRRLPVQDIPSGTKNPFPFQILGDPMGMRRELAELSNPAKWEELCAKYVSLTRQQQFELYGPRGGSASDALLDFMARPLPRRPVLILPEGDRLTALSCVPYARHTGALIFPDAPRTHGFIAELQPEAIHVVAGCSSGKFAGTVQRLPATANEIGVFFARASVRDHEQRSKRAGAPEDAVTSLLIAQMRPSSYVVLTSDAESESSAAALAANYAAALGSPLLTLRAEEPDMSASQLDATLREMNPTYLGLVSNTLMTSLEQVGAPPLSIRYACGHLCAPDPTSLALLICAAALAEDAPRESLTRVVIAEAAEAIPEAPLPGAREEGLKLVESLSRSADLLMIPISGPNDRGDFVEAIREASLVHFAGHGYYDPMEPSQSALIFSAGPFRGVDVPIALANAPIVFSNACESAVGDMGVDLNRSWSGLAAAFIEAGAVNYLGSLRPMYDESSPKASGDVLRADRQGSPDRRSASQRQTTRLRGGPIARVVSGDTWDDLRPARPIDFVGRDDMIQDVFGFLEAVREEKTSTRTFAVQGPSGWGKSSLVIKLADLVCVGKRISKCSLTAIDSRSATSATFVAGALRLAFTDAAQAGLIPQREPI